RLRAPPAAAAARPARAPAALPRAARAPELKMAGARVLVLGGHGHFGRLVVADLLALDAELVVAGRRSPRANPWPGRVRLAIVDQDEPASVRAALAGCAVAVHCAGPYQGLHCGVLAACIERGVPYVDLADARDFHARAAALRAAAEERRVPVLCGMSFLPRLAALLAAGV